MPVSALVLSRGGTEPGTRRRHAADIRGGRKRMSLLKRVEQAQRRASALEDGTVEIVVPPPIPVMAPSAATVSAREALLLQIRLRLQAEVMIAFNSLLDIEDPVQLRTKVDAIVERVLDVHGFAVTHDEREHLAEEHVGEIGGLGPLDPLLVDETITEIMVNG